LPDDRAAGRDQNQNGQSLVAGDSVNDYLKGGGTCGAYLNASVKAISAGSTRFIVVCVEILFS
jgi:hypothetical protein